MNNIQQKIVSAIKNENIIAKHIYQHHWISGSSTVVYPITLWQYSVDVQIDTKRNYFEKAIRRVLEKNQDIFEFGFFCKSDNSRPAFIRFHYTKNAIQEFNK